jgi:hypothetical protein
MAIIADSIYKEGRVIAGPASFLISIWRIELSVYMQFFIETNVDAI